MSDALEPPQLRFVPTLASAALASTVGGFLAGLFLYALQLSAPAYPNSTAIAGILALWALTAAGVYALNRQSIGRNRQERAERFVLCLLIAIPLQAPLWAVGVTVYDVFVPPRSATSRAQLPSSDTGSPLTAGSPLRRAGAIPNARILR